MTAFQTSDAARVYPMYNYTANTRQASAGKSASGVCVYVSGEVLRRIVRALAEDRAAVMPRSWPCFQRPVVHLTRLAFFSQAEQRLVTMRDLTGLGWPWSLLKDLP